MTNLPTAAEMFLPYKVPISQIIQHCYSLSYVANHDWN